MPQSKRTYAEFRQERQDVHAPIVPWEEFYHDIFLWKQGQHVACIGPTDSGKTTLSLAILDKRRYVVALCTKPRDDVLDALRHRASFYKMETWETKSPELYPKRILWPNALDLYSAQIQQKEFRKALSRIYREGNWCVYVDELWFIIHHLKMDLEIRTYLQQARSNGISLVVATQRPKFVPLEIYDQSQHLFFWRDTDEENLKRISGISWLNAATVRGLVARLERHQFLYVNTPTGTMYRSKMEMK